MRNIILWTWCFPQMLLGCLVKLFTRARKVGDHYEYNIESGSVSLGKYIFLCPSHWNNEIVYCHECGHQKQSMMLGWLYLIVIGIPSIIWAGCFKRFRKKYNISYYTFFTESWADRLGGVKR
jgi:hypothetical protein